MSANVPIPEPSSEISSSPSDTSGKSPDASTTVSNGADSSEHIESSGSGKIKQHSQLELAGAKNGASSSPAEPSDKSATANSHSEADGRPGPDAAVNATSNSTANPTASSSDSLTSNDGPAPISDGLPAFKKKLWLSLFLIYVSVAVTFGLVLSSSNVFDRQELQTINRRFEVRPWLNWSKQALERLNPVMLWDYHEKHENPRTWYSWDYTLSWLIEGNHPEVTNKIVIFNHMVEDEPPKDAIKSFPWMEPLLNYPLRRRTVGEMIETLAKSGARAIVLDNDFPQYSADDKYLAQSIHKVASGEFGKPIPIFMVCAVNAGSSGHMLRLQAPTAPQGILEQLGKLEPASGDMQEKYTGMTCVNQDADQVVRRIYTRLPSLNSKNHESVIVKVLEALGEKVPNNLPQLMDIDFAGPPNTDLYPVRPLSYLLDPEQKGRLIKREKQGDVNVDGAIVFIGDGVTDIYSTPFTNEGMNQMSGTEILANALDTISRASWPQRLTGLGSAAYLILCSIAGGVVWLGWKVFQHRLVALPMSQRHGSVIRLATDILFFYALLSGADVMACLIFAMSGLLVPIFIPSIALGMGTLAAIVWEREREREETFSVRLLSEKEKHELEREKLESELARSEVEAENREMYQDRKRRHEFVRRINHDLNAPVSVLNWTISELQMMELKNDTAREKIGRLIKSSDKLGELIDQLVQSYDYEILPGPNNNQAALCDLVQVLDDCIDGQEPLAKKFADSISWEKPENPLWVKANSLELSRVIDNIIRNAIKHNPNETQIFIAIESNGQFHKIIISDSGKGIPPEHLKRIFEPGYRVNPEKKDGHGLGLDIAKTLVEAMGGEVSVNSTLGQGTTFKLKLPLCSEAKAMHQDLFDDDDYDFQDETLEDQPALRKKTLEIAKHGE